MKLTENGIAAVAVCISISISILGSTWMLSGSLASIETQLVHIGNQLDKLEDRFNDHIHDHNGD